MQESSISKIRLETPTEFLARSFNARNFCIENLPLEILRSSSYEVVLNAAIFSGEPYFSRICKAVALKLLLKNGLNSGKIWSKMSVSLIK